MAITTAYDGKRKDGELIRYPLAAGVKIPKGALVVLIAGLAANAGDTAGVQFAGVAYETADNTGGGGSNASTALVLFGAAATCAGADRLVAPSDGAGTGDARYVGESKGAGADLGAATRRMPSKRFAQ